jgi:hypothetical protein
MLNPMIKPTTKIQTDLYIHAAREAVWQKFIRLHEWPAWQPNVSTVQWQQGDSWQEGAHFAVRASQGQAVNYVIRMVAPARVTVWETLNPALNTVYTLHCADQVGGCKVTLSCTVHGFAALATWVQQGRRRHQLHAQLEALKRYFDRK